MQDLLSKLLIKLNIIRIMLSMTCLNQMGVKFSGLLAKMGLQILKIMLLYLVILITAWFVQNPQIMNLLKFMNLKWQMLKIL
jgi:hypothetical protein